MEKHDAAMITLFGMQLNVFAVIILLMLFVFLFALFKAQRAHRLDWMDMITRDGTKVSTTKILQLIGGAVATWIVVKVTIQGTLTWDLFAIYLAYVASIDGFSKFIMARYGAEGSDDSRAPYRRSGGMGGYGGGYNSGGYNSGGYNSGGYGGYQDRGYQDRNEPPRRQPAPRQDNDDDEPTSRGSAKAIE